METLESKVVGRRQAGRARVVFFAVLGCYLVSFVLPTINAGNQVESHFKIGDAVVGWGVFWQVLLNLPFSIPYLAAWLANPVLWFGLHSLSMGRWGRARVAAWLSVALALTALWAASNDAHWLTILFGYYVWLLAMVLFVVGSEVVISSARGE